MGTLIHNTVPELQCIVYSTINFIFIIIYAIFEGFLNMDTILDLSNKKDHW